MLVAASAMVSIQLELGIRACEREVLIPMTDAVRRACRELLDQRAWLGMARAVQAGTDDALVQEAVRLAKADRAVHPTGGVLLIADHLAHAEALNRACSAAGVRTEGFDSLEASHATSVAIVVVTKDKGPRAAARPPNLFPSSSTASSPILSLSQLMPPLATPLG